MRLRPMAGVWSGRLTAFCSRLVGRGASTLPGHVALQVAPELLAELAARSRHGNLLVTGTNGKTTTTTLIAAILGQHGWRLIHNRSGANMLAGLTSAFLEAVGPSGRGAWDAAVLEVDEATMPAAARAVQPRVILVTNFFRDQLDRYGELDHAVERVRQGLEQLHSRDFAVLNADDPLVAELAGELNCRVLTFGIDAPGALLPPDDQTALGDAKRCRACGSRYRYSQVTFGHLGHYRCISCPFARPQPDVVLTGLRRLDRERSRLTLGRREEQTLELTTRLPGRYNIYNVLAAVTVAGALAIPAAVIAGAVTDFSTAFGRMETIEMEGRRVLLALIKNPVGAGQVLETVMETSDGSGALLVAINDRYADGRDISWLWDADFEQLARGHETFCTIIASGIRAEDMAVRLKYAGVPAERITVVGDLDRALSQGLAAIPPDGTLYALPTYTAMLDLRRVFQRRGHVTHYLEA